MNGINIDPFLIRWWRFGIPADFWLKNIKMIEQVIREQKLAPVSAESLPEMPLSPTSGVAMEEKGKAALRIKPRPFPGGIRIPHLHFKGDIYLLNEKQWAEFSGKVVKDFQAKLSKANTVSFEQVIEISEAMDRHM